MTEEMCYRVGDDEDQDDMALYTNGNTIWTHEQMRDVVFPSQIEGVDMDQFIGGELSFEDWLAESVNTGIYRKVHHES